MPLILEPDTGPLEYAVALNEHLLVAVDQDVGDRRVLQQWLERAQAQQLVQNVADQALALGIVERLILLRQLFVDDVADFRLDLLARHLVERLEVDDVEQALVKLDLEIGMLVALGECARFTDGDQPMLFDALSGGALRVEAALSPFCGPATF